MYSTGSSTLHGYLILQQTACRRTTKDDSCLNGFTRSKSQARKKQPDFSFRFMVLFCPFDIVRSGEVKICYQGIMVQKHFILTMLLSENVLKQTMYFDSLKQDSDFLLYASLFGTGSCGISFKHLMFFFVRCLVLLHKSNEYQTFTTIQTTWRPIHQNPKSIFLLCSEFFFYPLVANHWIYTLLDWGYALTIQIIIQLFKLKLAL